MLEQLLGVFICAHAIKHPVFKPTVGANSIDALKAQVKPIFELTEEDLIELIPTRSGFTFIGCPNCDEGTQEGELSWSIEDPKHVFCRYCQMRFPNEQFPDGCLLKVTNPLGEEQEYPYWEDENGYRYFFQAKGWYVARGYFSRVASDLATLFYLTDEGPYARRAALILDRFAQVYPGYCVTNDYPGRQKSLFEGNEPPYPYWGGKWSRWFYGDIPRDLALVYDRIYASGELEKLADEQGVDVKERIEKDFFRAAVEFVRTYPIYLGNMDPTIHRGLITVGRVIGEPDIVHDAVTRITQLFTERFFFDGVWKEGAVSYHNQTIGGLRAAIALLKGYSDPEGYAHPQDGRHFANLNLAAEFPIIDKAMCIPELLKYPNGRTVPIHDTWAKESRSPTDGTGPMLLPALGHARLGRGEGENQMQVHLHFSGGYGHQHNDVLNVTLFARGHELLSDIGYTHTRYRRWSTSTLAHNTVTVDGVEQHGGSEDQPSDGNLLLYVPGDEMFQAVEASGERAYPDRVQTYRRTLLLVGVSPETAYVVDIFRVTGGKRHEYVLHGDADYAGTIETDLPLADYGKNLLPANTPWRLPIRENDSGDAGEHNIAYAFMREVKWAKPAKSWIATFKAARRGVSLTGPPAYLSVHGLPEAETELFFGVAPSIRRADENDANVDDFTMPILVARREGENLTSTFVSVFEPHSGEPVLKSVERIATTGSDVALKIAHGDATDFILSRLDDASETELNMEDLSLRGRLGFARRINGRIDRMCLIDGTHLRQGDCELKVSGPIEGKVLGVLRQAGGDTINGFVVDVNISPSEQLKGATLINFHPDGFTYGYEIKNVMKIEGQTVIELTDEPGYEIEDGKTRLVFFPQRESEGENRFRITNYELIVSF